MHKSFKLKFIFPYRFEYASPYSYTLFNFLPYGMGVVAAFLRQHNYYIEQQDLSAMFNCNSTLLSSVFKNIVLDLHTNKEEIRGFLKSGTIKGKLNLFIDKILYSVSPERFDAIGFSIFTSLHFIFAIILASKIKQRTNIPIVFGGPFMTLYGQLYPRIFNFIDYIIIGDGGVPLLRLIDYLEHKIPISEVPNLLYRDNGKITANPQLHYPLEDMPTPDFTDLPLNLYKSRYADFLGFHALLPYQISRGCTAGCSFCNNYIIDKLEFKSYEKVLSELRQMKERYKENSFYFCDNAINNSYEYLDELCGLFIKNNLGIRWNGYARVGNLDKHILKKMKEAGCQWLTFGIESGSDRILKSMNKGFTPFEASRTLNDAAEVGLKNSLCFIAGYPHETQEDVKKTIEFISKNRKNIHQAFVHRFILKFGSKIYNYPDRFGIENLKPINGNFEFSFDEIGGLKWIQKEKQQAYSVRKIEKTFYKNAGLKFKSKIFCFFVFRSLRYIIVKFKKIKLFK